MTLLRQGNAGDVAAIMALGRETFASVFPVDGLALSVETLLSTVAVTDDGWLQVAEDGGQVVGFLAGFAQPFLPWSIERAGVELLFYIAPAARRGTLAARMLGDFRAWATTRGCRLLVASAQAGLEGQRVARLYRRLGMEEQETNYIMRLA